MKRPIALVVLTCMIASLGVSVSARHAEPEFDLAAPTSDEVIASFQRELERTPGPRKPVHGTSIDEDVLYRELNRVHWRDDQHVGD